jgi:hypothetical protein
MSTITMKQLGFDNHIYRSVHVGASPTGEYDGEPIALLIIKSGWEDEYHVITEWGAYGEVDFTSRMSSESIQKKYGIDVNTLFPKTIIVDEEFAKRYPNDFELGTKIRNSFNA